MRKDNRTNILFRYALLVVVILAVSMTIVAKMVDTTVISAPEWNKKAMEELSSTVTIKPERGNILAADGNILAANMRFYTVRIDYRSEKFNDTRFIQAIDSLADSMATVFGRRSRDQWKAHLLRPLSKEKKERPRAYPVITNINYAQMLRLKTFPFFNLRNRNRNGLTVENYLKRVHPYGNMARRSIGGVGQTAECAEIHGISGLEKALDSLLYGKPGVARKVPLTRDVTNWTDSAAVPGYDIVTTIDIHMQDIVEHELNARLEWLDADWGVTVLMEVATGDIKAISNLEKNPDGPGYIEGMNRAVLGYEPGSVVKTLSMMIALEDGIVTDPTAWLSTGRSWAYAGGRPISDAHGVDGLTVAEVIERSSNIGMAKIITSRYDAHPGGFYSRLKQIGFLEKLNTGIAGETAPRIDSMPSDRGGRIGLSRQSYGYATEIPPLHTLSIYNAIANGGRYVRPRLVSRIIGQDVDSVLPVTYIRNRICSEQNAATLRRMLTSVVWGDHGTARRLKSDLVKLAGKTGTCYMIENGAYNTSRKRLAFCGFFPADEPRYSCITLIANPRQNAFGAGSTSGEVVKGIALKMYSRGMLGPGDDFDNGSRPDPSARGAAPVYHASLSTPNLGSVLHSALAIGGKHRSFRAPRRQAAKGCVPDVVGLGPREAIATLEQAGYNVASHGSGAVTDCRPQAGTRLAPGSTVAITMRN